MVPVYFPHAGGVQKHVEELAAGLIRRGIAVDVLAQELDRSLPVEVIHGRLTVRRFPVPLPLLRYTIAPSLLTHLRRNAARYDVVHAHNYHEVAPLLVGVSRAANLVLTSHYHPPSGGTTAVVLRAPHRLLSRTVMRSFGRIICVSEAEAAALSLEQPGISARTRVISNGVDAARIRQATPMDVGRPYVLSVSRLDRHKRVDETIRAAGLGHHDLVIAGDGPERRRLESAARNCPAVRFLGQVDDDELHRWIRGASVVVTLSDRAAFGLVILEAFAAGVPVVASDIPAHRETVRFGPPTASSLVPVGADPQLLRDSIDQMAISGRRGFRSSVPSWDDMAEHTLGVYTELAASPSN